MCVDRRKRVPHGLKSSGAGGWPPAPADSSRVRWYACRQCGSGSCACATVPRVLGSGGPRRPGSNDRCSNRLAFLDLPVHVTRVPILRYVDQTGVDNPATLIINPDAAADHRVSPGPPADPRHRKTQAASGPPSLRPVPAILRESGINLRCPYNSPSHASLAALSSYRPTWALNLHTQDSQ